MTVTWDLVNKKPSEAERSVKRNGKNFTFGIPVPPRQKLYKEDILFLEDYAYLRIDSQTQVHNLTLSVKFGEVLTPAFDGQNDRLYYS